MLETTNARRATPYDTKQGRRNSEKCISRVFLPLLQRPIMSVMSGLHPIFTAFSNDTPLRTLPSSRTGSWSNWLMVELVMESANPPETSAEHFPAIDFAAAELTPAMAQYYH